MRTRIGRKHHIVFEYQNVVQSLPLCFLDDLAMRKSAPDVRIGRGADRREPADARRDSELFKARHHRLPALRGGIKVNAVDRIEEIEWVAQLLRHRSDDAVGGFSPNVFAKMLDYVRRIAA